MATTLSDLQTRLKEQCSPDDVCELLDLSSEQLVDRFGDIIEEKWDYLVKELDMEEDDPDQT